MGLDLTVTHRKLSLGTQDDVTGWYAKEFNESDIDMYIQDRGATVNYLPAGWFPRLDAGGMTPDPVWTGDEIETLAGKFYEVKTIKEVMIADSFEYRLCDLAHLPLHGLTYSTTTPTVKDARFNTKDYWDDYLDSDNLQTTAWIVCYSDPPYPLVRLFTDKSMDLIFTVDYPKTTPLIGATGSCHSYLERVSTHVFALDTELAWLGEHELRRIVEENPEGSHRDLETLDPVVHELGSAKLYDIPVVMAYRRGLT